MLETTALLGAGGSPPAADTLDALEASLKLRQRADYFERRTEFWQRYRVALEEALSSGVKAIQDISLSPGIRAQAVRDLGLLSPHTAFRELLLEIAREQSEHRSVRYAAITSLSAIPSDRVVVDLIAYVDEDQIGDRAFEQLGKLTRSGIRHDRSQGSLRAAYDKWWAENRSAFAFERIRVLEER